MIEEDMLKKILEELMELEEDRILEVFHQAFHKKL